MLPCVRASNLNVLRAQCRTISCSRFKERLAARTVPYPLSVPRSSVCLSRSHRFGSASTSIAVSCPTRWVGVIVTEHVAGVEVDVDGAGLADVAFQQSAEQVDIDREPSLCDRAALPDAAPLHTERPSPVQHLKDGPP